MRRCSMCGFENLDEATVCIKCGEPFPPVHKNGSVGERRETTVLVVGVENLSGAAHLDSEAKYLIADELMRLLVDIVYEHEGTIDKLSGDGILALFGVPHVHENDPERAVRAALGMLSGLEELNRRISQTYQVTVHIRIGIHTGWVILGKSTADMQVTYNIVNSTLAVAAKLQTTAERDTVRISLDTYKRAKPYFIFKELPAISLRNASRSIPVFQPVDVRVFPAKVRGFFGFQVPLVGRNTELAQLQQAFSTVAEQNTPRVAFITGEAGMGKSRLVAEFHRTLSPGAVSVAEGRCNNYSRTKSFSLLTDLLRDIIRLSDVLPPSQQRGAVRMYLERLKVPVDDIYPYVLEVIGVPTDDEAMVAKLARLDSAVRQRLIFAALRHLLIAEAQRRPLILILEDLHWVDAASQKFIAHLLQTVTNQPIMFVLVARHNENSDILDSLREAARQHIPLEIFLKPLDQSDMRALVESLMYSDQPDAAKVFDRLAHRAAGNPFFAEEIIRSLIEQGVLSRDAQAWRLTAAADETLFNRVPDTLHGLIMARYDRLDPPLQQVLRIAAVLGASFSIEVLYEFNNWDADTLRGYLKTLEERQFLTKDKTAERETYYFCHTLFQEVIYSILLSRDREKLHYRAANILARSAHLLPEEREDALAFHYFHSLDPKKALPHLQAAAENAMRRSANEVAIQYFRQALSLMDTDASEQKWLTQLGLGQALKFTGQYAEASRILDEALQQLLFQSLKVPAKTVLPVLVNGLRELADIRAREGKLDEAVTHLQAGLDALGEGKAQRHSPLWYLLIERLAWVRFRQGNLDEAFSLASWATMESDDNRDENPIVLASLFNTLGGIFWQWGNQAKAVTYVSLSLDYYKKLGYAWGMATAYANLGVLYSAQGKWQKSLEYLSQAYTLRQDNGYIPELALNLFNLGLLRQAMGDHEHAAKDFSRSLEISERLGDEFGIGWARIGLGYLALLQNELPAARRHIEAVLKLKNGATEELIIQADWILGLIAGGEGNPEAGLQIAQRALELAQSANLNVQEAKARRVLGILHTQLEHYFEAEVLFREAVDLFLQLNDVYWQALTLLDMGNMYHRLAHRDEIADTEALVKSRSALQEAVQYFERLGAAYDLQRAQKALQTVRDSIAKAAPEGIAATASASDDAAVPEAEWHTVTVLWLKLTPGATTDEELVFEALTTIVPEITAIADDFHGRLTRRHDGLMVVFGAPIAYEDDAERAVYAALQMFDFLNQFFSTTDVSFDYSATVSLGKVIAGKMGSRHHSEFVVRGEIVQLSQQLSQIVPTGEIWVTDSVRHATKRVFQYRPLPADIALPAIGETVWAFDRALAKPAPARGMPGIKAKLVGRTEILEKMNELAEQLGQGIGGVIWLEGEPGIGKSRLMQEFLDAIADEQTMVWMGKCSPQKSTQSFSVFSELLARGLNVKPNAPAEAVRAQITAFYKTLPPPLQMTRPYMESLLGVLPDDAGGQRLKALEPQQLRQQIFVAFRRLFQGISRRQPVVIALDDLHWVDPISVELIQFLMSMVAASPILFVCAQRRQGGDAPNDRLVKAQSLMPLQTIRFRLERLTVEESRLLVQNLLPNVELPPKVCDLILSRSEGNPYFIEEFVRMLIEQEYLQRIEGKWHINTDKDMADLALPASLETLIRSRIDVLPAELKQVIHAAAVIDEPFDLPLLETLIAPNEVGASLARLESRLLVRRDSGGEWVFNHSLIQTVAYHAVLQSQRQSLHRMAATHLLSRWGDQAADHAETLAYHFTRANDPANALCYLVIAGERAALRFANDESLAYFRQAQSALDALPDASNELRWRVALGLGDVYRGLGKYAESIAAFETAADLLPHLSHAAVKSVGLYRRWGETARKQGDYATASEKFKQALATIQQLNDTAELQFERVRALTGLAWVHLVQGDFDAARKTAETSLSEAQKINAVGEMAAAENLLGGLFYRQRNWTLALHHTMRAMVFREQIGYSWGVAGSLSNLGILAVAAGHWNKAHSFFERSLAQREEMGDVEGMVIVYSNLGTLAKDQGALEVAEQYFRKSLSIATQFKMNWQVVNSTVGLGQVLSLQKRYPEAKAAIESSMAQADAIGAEDIKVEIYCAEAELLLAQSMPDDARQAAERAIAQAQKVGNRVMESAAWRVIAAVERQHEQFSAAWQALETADRLLANGADELEMARVLFEKGRLAMAEGDETQARENIRVAQEIFMRLGANLDIERVSDLLKRKVLLR